jgi:hypothetical protein
VTWVRVCYPATKENALTIVGIGALAVVDNA